MFARACALRGMRKVRVHDLVELDRSWIERIAESAIREALVVTPWAVVRRACAANGSVAIGIRGTTRDGRWPLVAPHAAILSCVTPESLVTVVPRRRLPALLALSAVRRSAVRADIVWGPVGGVGFELATGSPVVTAQSDCDIIVRTGGAWSALAAFASDVRSLGVRVDAQVEAATFGFALDELLGASGSVMAKTPTGPQLVASPIARASA